MKNLNLNKMVIASAVQSVPEYEMAYYQPLDKHVPEVGDVVLAKIINLGQHTQLENRNARIHMTFDHSLFIGAWGNRYATDYYEGLVPNKEQTEADLLARGGVIGNVASKFSMIKEPTRVKILGYIFNKENKLVNTRNYPIIDKKPQLNLNKHRKLILVVGTSMNAGKSTAAKAVIYSLAVKEKSVAAGKVTGTASLKDLLLMEDSGANEIIDFSHLGYPSTYKLPEEEIINIFTNIYAYLSSFSEEYIVLEIADGILQRETMFLLKNPLVQEKIYKLIFCATDPVAVKGGVDLLKNRFNLVPDAISGRAVNSVLGQEEIKQFSDKPMFNSMEVKPNQIYNIIE